MIPESRLEEIEKKATDGDILEDSMGLASEVLILTAEIRRLREALEFYAQSKPYEDAGIDWGVRARKALGMER